MKKHMNKHWKEAITEIKDKKNAGVHKFYSSKGGWAYLTDKKRYRWKVTFRNTISYIKSIINKLKQ